MSIKDFKELRVLKQNIIFQFVEETTSDGQFKQSSREGLIVIEDKHKQMDKPRWAEVMVTGDDVEGIEVGDYIYIKSLQWTPHFKYERDLYWTTDQDQIIAVSSVEPPVDI